MSSAGQFFENTRDLLGDLLGAKNADVTYMWYLHVLCTWLVDIPKLPNQNLGKSRSRHTIPKRGQKFYNVTWVRCQPNECQSLWTCVNFGLADFESQPISLFTFLSY
jgi:hypothetical protein